MLRPKSKPLRRSVNIPISSQLIEDAKALSISRAAEAGIAKAVAAEKTHRRQEENKDTIAGWNAYVEMGCP